MRIVRGNVREPDQVVGDLYALVTCNEVGHRRLVDMMQEFHLADLHSSRLGEFSLGPSCFALGDNEGVIFILKWQFGAQAV